MIINPYVTSSLQINKIMLCGSFCFRARFNQTVKEHGESCHSVSSVTPAQMSGIFHSVIFKLTPCIVLNKVYCRHMFSVYTTRRCPDMIWSYCACAHKLCCCLWYLWKVSYKLIARSGTKKVFWIWYVSHPTNFSHRLLNYLTSVNSKKKTT